MIKDMFTSYDFCMKGEVIAYDIHPIYIKILQKHLKIVEVNENGKTIDYLK